MQIYVFRDNQQAGPFSEAEVKAQLASGAITRETLVWWDGQPDWKPLGQTPLGTATATTLPPAPLTASVPAPAVPVAGAFAPSATRTSSMATASLVCGILGFFCGFLAIGAVITGHMARKEIRKDPTLSGSGLALAGLILGYIEIVLIVIVLAIYGVLFSYGLSQGLKNAQSSQDDSDTNSAPMTNTAPATPDSSTNNAPAPDNSTNSPAATPTPSQ